MANNTVKITCVGDGATGKTCCLSVYALGEFPEAYVPTVFENYTTVLNLPNGNEVTVSLFDTAGQDDYERLRPLSYPNTNCVVLVFDITDPVTFENAEEKWVKEIRHYLPNVPIVFVGNKSDLRGDQHKLAELRRRGISPLNEADIKERIINLGGCNYFEASAKNSVNIKEAFNYAAFAGSQQSKGKTVPVMGGSGKSKKKKWYRFGL